MVTRLTSLNGSCKMNLETVNLPYEGGTFALISKPSRSTTSYFHRQSSAKECFSCRRRDDRLPVISNSLAELRIRRRSNVTGYERKVNAGDGGRGSAAVYGGVFEHGARPRLRNLAGAFGKDRSGCGCEAVGQSCDPFHAAQGSWGAYIFSDPQRSDRASQSVCAGVGGKFSQQVNKFDFTRQAFCRDLRLCGKPVFVGSEIWRFN